VSTQGLRIRDAIFQRLDGWPGFNSFELTPMGTAQPDKLPSLAVYLSGEVERADGDANVTEPKFINDVTIGLAFMRKAGDQTVLEGSLDSDVDGIKSALLTDPTFVHFGGAYQEPPGEDWAIGIPIYWDKDLKRATLDPINNVLLGVCEYAIGTNTGVWRVGELFEGVTQITRRNYWPNNGETYFAEVRLEMTFQVRISYPPVIEDDYLGMRLTTHQLGNGADAPAIITVIDAVS
jgi:hypothetical protein